MEAGEECDCGYDDNECVDKCCYPRQVSELDKMKNDTAKGCSRKYGTQCRYMEAKLDDFVLIGYDLSRLISFRIVYFS